MREEELKFYEGMFSDISSQLENSTPANTIQKFSEFL